jgi:UDP-glucose 4-epimerase
MRALVTGGAGFIGSNVVDALLHRGDHVVVVDDLSTGRRENVAAAATLVEASIDDGAALAEVFDAHRPEVVFHLAAQIDVRRSVEDPGHDARVNVGGTITLLEAARQRGARRVVYSSTGGALYGDSVVIPTPEDAPIAPLAPYGQSKWAGEAYCLLYERLHHLSTVSLRYANVYGPRQDPAGEAGVVAIFSEHAQRGGRATVFGDGRQTRDFVYVDDVVAANLVAATSDAVGAYNVGLGEETSVLELAGALGVAYDLAPERPGEVRRSCLDASLARRELGWEPTVDVAEGLRRTLQWMQRRAAA